MKKILSVAMLLMLSVTLCAQKDVTQFLGIPVDGSKYAMIQKLKAKGYTSSPTDKEILVGKFNGADVYIHIATNNNKVCRILVNDVNSVNETDIKIRFNKLCQQFQNNEKYLTTSTSSSDYTLSDAEDISYEMLVNNKRYQAAYTQLSENVDTVGIISFFLSKYTKEQLSNPSEEMREDMQIMASEYVQDTFSKKSVWFMISELRGKYYISMFYDNGYNQASGEDL